MSSHSYTDICPNCDDETLRCCTSNKPFENGFGECCRCGFYFTTISGFSNITEINDLRKEENNLENNKRFRMLKNLPKQNKDLVWS